MNPALASGNYPSWGQVLTVFLSFENSLWCDLTKSFRSICLIYNTHCVGAALHVTEQACLLYDGDAVSTRHLH